jgi:hypothetical protein
VGVKVRRPKGHKSWCVVIDHEGQRRTKAIGTREAAERVKREIEARLTLGDLGVLGSPQRTLPTLREYARTWHEAIGQECKPSTAGFYGQYLRLYVLPRFGELPMDSVSRQEVKQFISELRARGLSKNTIRLAVTTLRAVLSAAQEDRLIQDNPARGLGRFVNLRRRNERLPRSPPIRSRVFLALRKTISVCVVTPSS